MMFFACSPAADNFQLEYKVSKNGQVKVRSIENSTTVQQNQCNFSICKNLQKGN